jgi:hypothetical protein
MPEQDRPLACRRDGGDVLLPRACSECEDKNRAAAPTGAASRPASITMPRACPLSRLVIRLWHLPGGPDCRALGFRPRWPVIKRSLFHR